LFFGQVEVGTVALLKTQLESKFIKKTFRQTDLVNFKLKLNASEFIAVQSTLFPNLSEIA
jgi:hypothetical protein